MSDAIDGYIQQALKNWAAQQRPPANGRARLLLLASSPSAQRAYYERQQATSLDTDKTVAGQTNLASDFYNLPYLLAVQLTYTTLRRVT
jgi:hypothetical protein